MAHCTNVHRSLKMGKKRAFTLIELLVVIAIIALLLSILMPSLRRAKEAGKRAQCLFNVKSLTAGMLMYVPDFDNQFPNAWTELNGNGWILSIPDHYNTPEKASKEEQLDAIRGGLLFPYLNSTSVYRCPVARKNEFRTYSMTHALNGIPLTETYSGTTKILKKITEIRTTSNRIVFLDDYITDYDACWMIFNDQTRWWNTTPIRHGSGGNVFSFADGHSDFQIWRDQDTISLAEKYNDLGSPDAKNDPASLDPGNVDILWAQKATWGKLGYVPTP